MNKDLQQKLSQLIEANFSKMESEVLTRLVSEHESLTKELVTYRGLYEDARKEKISLESDLVIKRRDFEEIKKEKDALQIEFDKLKKESVELELKCVKESKREIFDLVKVVFRNPDKVRKFDMPVVDEYSSSNSGNGNYSNSNKTNKTLPITETISEE